MHEDISGAEIVNFSDKFSDKPIIYRICFGLGQQAV
jgi:hypothetical protein